MARIAILTSTSPLRKTGGRAGRTKQELNLDACAQLADQFERVLVGSAAPDAVFDHITRNLPRSIRSKFRFYPQSFFRKHQGKNIDDPRDPGWQAILAENGIDFDTVVTVVNRQEGTKTKKQFEWRSMADFISDSETVFVSGTEGRLGFTRPTRFRGR